MKLDLESAVIERNQITGSFSTQISPTSMIATDKTDHGFWVQKVYRGLLHEKSVIEECYRRFKKTFEPN